MSADGIQLIVGLGNPGPEYDQTRHNAGFWFVERLTAREGAVFRKESRFLGEACKLQLEGRGIWLLKPMTFMNRSGQSVRQFCDFYRIPPEAVLVAHDELDLSPGTVRLKQGGGHGGHNGLRDLIRHIGADFWRLRIGIGHPGHKDQVVDYVLHRASREEQAQIDEAIDEALSALPLIVRGEMQQAMNRLHSKR